MPLKGTTIEGVDIDVSAFKHGDTTVDFHINLSNIYGDPVRANTLHTFTAKVANTSGYIGDYPCTIDGVNLLIDSNEFFQLPPDNYSMEIWETWTNSDGTKDTAIYPSPSKVLRFTINENIKDKTGEIVKRFDFQEAVENTVKSFLKNHPGSGDVDLRDYAKKSDIERQLGDYAKKSELPKIVLDERSRVLDINGQELTIPESVDLSGYAKKGEVPQVTYDAEHRSLTVNGVAVDLPASVDLSNYYTKAEMDDKLSKVATGGTVDLTGYLKVTDADKKYATKQEIPDVSGLAKKTDLDDYAKKSAVPVISLDAEARKLTLNGATINIPASVDLSGYATKQELPKITYDQATKSLTINGAKIELPSNVDLSGYYTKSEVDDKLAQAATGGKVDLTGYLTKTEASKTYATKAELPDMNNVATKDEIPSIDGLAKESELHDYAKKTDIPAAPDLTPYLKSVDADKKYAAKSDIPSLDDYAKKTDLPKEPDLSGYETKQEASDAFATKAEVPSIEGLAKEADVPKVVLDVTKRTLTINGQTVDIPGNVDLSHFYTKDEVDKKLTDIASGGKVDLTGYLTKVAADDSYLAKDSIVLDTDKRILKLGGQTINIPSSVDLSGYLTKTDAEEIYAKKEDLPSLNGYAKLTDIPSITGLVKEAELADYAKKTDLPSLDDYAKKEDVPSVDGLAKESEIPQIKLDTAARTLTLGETTISIPDAVDLSGYATKGEIPKVSINSETRTITINDQSISIPTGVDLSGYYTKDEVDAEINQAKPDLAPYLKTADADKKYAEKAALDSYLTQTTASATYATKAEIPAVPDMSQYAEKSDVAAVDTKAAAAMNKAVTALQKASENVIDYDKVADVIKNIPTSSRGNQPKTYGKKFACFGDSIWSDDVCKIGTMIPDFIGLKLVGNFAIGAATASDWKDTNGTNISPISLARAKNASSAENTLSNQVRRLLQWTTPSGEQISWKHPTAGTFSIPTSYGTGLGHTSDVPDIIGISIGVNDGYIPQVQFAPNTDFSLALAYKDLQGTVNMVTGLRWAIETLQSAYPFTQIFLFTPFQCAMKQSNNYTYDITKQKAEVIRKVGEFESVPVIDQFRESGLNQTVITANSNEGLHPNYTYARRAAAFDANRICELYYSMTEHSLPVPHPDKTNLWTGTDDYTGNWINAAYTQSPSLYQGLTVYSDSASGGNIAQPITLEPGKYTFSCFLKWEGTTDSNHTLKPSMFISRYDDTTQSLKGVIYDVTLADDSLSKDWTRFTFTFTLSKEEHVLIYISQGWGTAQGSLYLAGQKLEKGDKATPYVKMDGTTVTAPDYSGQVTSKYSE